MRRLAEHLQKVHLRMSAEDILGPAPKRKKKPGRPKVKAKPKLSRALAKMAARSLDVDKDDIRSYLPTELDLQMAEAMIAGKSNFTEIAKHIGTDASIVSRAMKDPTRCAWLSDQLHRIVGKRMGLVDAALMLRALSGDVRAIKLYYERFDGIVHRSHVVHTNIDFDPSQLTDADLDTVLRNEAAGSDIIIDVEVEEAPSKKETGKD